MDILQFLKDNTVLVSLSSLGVSTVSLVVSASNNRNFARNEFVKKQISVVTELVESLHNDIITFEFTTFGENGSRSMTSLANVFEIQEVAFANGEELLNKSICFPVNCNQLLNIKRFIDNPFLPKSIADELENFYSRSNRRIDIEDLTGEQIIVAHTKHFEEGIFDNKQDEYLITARVIKEPECFAMKSWENLVECSRVLELAIVRYVQRYKVEEINIRKDFKHII